MKIALLSDLHLSVHPLSPPASDADIVVLAGDIGRPAAALEWARQFDRPTLLIAGNHEFYGSDLVTTVHELRERSRGTQVVFLEREAWHRDGVRFLGCTLWSDHRLHASRAERDEGLRQSQALMRDFARIRIAPDFPDPFTPAVSQMLFDSSVAWLETQFAHAHDGPTVVVTHFAPSRGSIAERFAGSPINTCFVSDLEERILRWQPALWLHGHTHDSFDYRIGGTRVVANPRGYAPGGVIENRRFDPSLVIDV
ncbi:MAG TPA: metallophosphoesterase [Albitalea sp.]|uniref:metallophosphoesterase n=1 Tax=Piscinibacter sp. TaxID=1903157 RepID=UPI002ED107A9